MQPVRSQSCNIFVLRVSLIILNFLERSDTVMALVLNNWFFFAYVLGLSVFFLDLVASAHFLGTLVNVQGCY